MQLDIPNHTMRVKLESLLKDEAGIFRYHPKIISGLSQLRRFQLANIACPEFTTELSEAKLWLQMGHRVFGRDANHERGADIVDSDSRAWVRKQFWTKVIPVEREYRIHIFDSMPIHHSLKELDPNATPTRTDGLPIRNTSTGYRYNHTFLPPSQAIELARSAVSELGYLWGGVDILEDPSGSPYVLEVNSAPGMGEPTALAYADAIRRYARGQGSL